MNIMPLGDYYAWYCEWCDSRNLTLWTKFEKNEVLCGACQRSLFAISHTHGHTGKELALTGII
jgi:hypothetical protein